MAANLYVCSNTDSPQRGTTEAVGVLGSTLKASSQAGVEGGLYSIPVRSIFSLPLGSYIECFLIFKNSVVFDIFWTCPTLRQFSNAFFNDIDRAFDTNLPQNFKTAILGIVPAGFEGRAKIYLLHILLAAAKKLITIHWLDVHPLTMV